MPDFKIAIIGAGPAGCTLGRLLHLAKIDFVIYEGESSPNARFQGGTLDLRDNTGLAAIKEAQLYEKFLKYARYDGEALTMADKNFVKYISASGSTPDSKPGMAGARPEIDRRDLRALLWDSLPKDAIKWGRHLQSVSEDLTLHFKDGGEEKGFDLIVGADGAWSKTRLFLSSQMPFYTGISGTELYIPDVATRYPDLHELVNRGSIFSYSDGYAITAQQMGDGSMRVADWGVRDENWSKEVNLKNMQPQAIKELLERDHTSWVPQLRKFIAVADDRSIITRSLFMLPIGFQWQNKPGVTIIGDAAHLMGPFAGEGANLAMAEAMYLAESIKKSTSREDLYVNVATLEKNMHAKAKASQQQTFDNMTDMFFTPGAPRAIIERYIIRLIRHMKGDVAAALATVPVYIYFWWFKLFH